LVEPQHDRPFLVAQTIRSGDAPGRETLNRTDRDAGSRCHAEPAASAVSGHPASERPGVGLVELREDKAFFLLTQRGDEVLVIRHGPP